MKRPNCGLWAAVLVGAVGLILPSTVSAGVSGTFSGQVRADNAQPLFELLPKDRAWKSRTVRYFAGDAKKYRKQIRQAVEAWNTSGVKFRWKPASRRDAKLDFVVTRNVRGDGEAISDGRNGTIKLAPGLLTGAHSPQEANVKATALVAHEMGHIMGLDHSRKCAAMQAFVHASCKPPSDDWLYRCRILEADDIAGAIKVYGGKRKQLAPKFCAFEPAPRPLEEFAGTWDPDQQNIVLTWKPPQDSDLRTLAILSGGPDGPCPAYGKGDPYTEYVNVANGRAKPSTGTWPGDYCLVAVVLSRKYERPSAPVKVVVRIP